MGVGPGISRGTLDVMTHKYPPVMIDSFGSLGKYFSSEGARLMLKPQAEVMARGYNWIKVKVSFDGRCYGYEFELFDTTKSKSKNVSESELYKNIMFEAVPNPDEPIAEIVVTPLPANSMCNIRFYAYVDPEKTIRSSEGRFRDSTTLGNQNFPLEECCLKMSQLSFDSSECDWKTRQVDL